LNSKGENFVKQKVIYGINGPVVTVKDTDGFFMQEMVYVGHQRLVGEVIGIADGMTTIQVYEVTTDLKPGEPVAPAGNPLALTLGPGILTNIFDGIERPLQEIQDKFGPFINKGATVSSLDTEKQWDVTITVQVGDQLCGGQIYATCPETPVITHKMMVPPNLSGKVIHTNPNGLYRLMDTVVVLETETGQTVPLTLCQFWPIRNPRPTKERLPIEKPLITGQRVIDTLFPVAKGGAAAIPGGFGTGKTMTQHQLAKWCDADIIIYVGCGERGNEMTQVLDEFGGLVDPRTGKELRDRTVLIANTSNMPVAAREASIYTGITLAEYYRDMGYDVAMMADSTSRWAEALREISGRLEEMPAEEGFPAYLPSRLSAFYERAGNYEALSGEKGSITVIGAVSPQGSDFSEPVTQNTKRFTRCFWALDKTLAYARHYPAIQWMDSYSEYDSSLGFWYNTNVDSAFMQYRSEFLGILREENNLMEIVKLIGDDVLPDHQKLILEIARIIRTGFLQQNAYHKEDTYVSLKKQFLMMKTILHLYHAAKTVTDAEIPLKNLTKTGIFEKLIAMRTTVPGDDEAGFEALMEEIDQTVFAVKRRV
jgi:V/A-type H+-transporting ATPase subunit A